MLQRFSSYIESVVIDSTLADSDEILMGSYSMGVFVVPAGETMTSITWYVAEKPGGTYWPLTDEFGSAVVQVVAAENSYQLPSSLAGAVAIKGVGDADGTIHLCLKG